MIAPKITSERCKICTFIPHGSRKTDYFTKTFIWFETWAIIEIKSTEIIPISTSSVNLFDKVLVSLNIPSFVVKYRKR